MICLDECGPLAVRSYPTPSWSDEVHRPHFRPDYARFGYRWAYGAFEPRTGRVQVQTVATRDTASWLTFLDQLEAFVPPGEAYLIADALPLHWSLDTMLWNWGHPRFHFIPLPKAAAWLNLIEGFGRSCASAPSRDVACGRCSSSIGRFARWLPTGMPIPLHSCGGVLPNRSGN